MHACWCSAASEVTAPEGGRFSPPRRGRFASRGQRQMNDVTRMLELSVTCPQHLFLLSAPDRRGFCICATGGELEFRIKLECVFVNS